MSSRVGSVRAGGGGGGMRRCACACALALLCAALAHADAGKRAEMSAVPFVMGSRYGRSSPRYISPRNDRFFMGSRYGKRSQLAAAGRPDAPDARTRAKLPSPLVCEYTGLYPLYRCEPAHERSLYIHTRSDDVDSGPGERA